MCVEGPSSPSHRKQLNAGPHQAVQAMTPDREGQMERANDQRPKCWRLQGGGPEGRACPEGAPELGRGCQVQAEP